MGVSDPGPLCFRYQTTAIVREFTPRDLRMLPTWFLTVFSAMERWWATSLFLMPLAINPSTSYSRSVSAVVETIGPSYTTDTTDRLVLGPYAHVIRILAHVWYIALVAADTGSQRIKWNDHELTA